MSSKAAEKLILKVEPGEILCKEGDRGDEMFVIQQGKVRLSRKAGDEVQEIAVLGKGDFFGEMALLEGLAHSETAEAVEASELLRVNGLVFNKMITKNAEIAVRMLRKISNRLAAANDKISVLLVDSTHYSKASEVPREAAIGATAAFAPPTMPKAVVMVNSSQRQYPIGKPLTLIGRHDPVTDVHPEIDLSTEKLGKSVSRRHAKIEYRDGQFFLTEEIGTLNNTTVNGVKLETGVMTPLIDGDEIGLGAVKLTFRDKF